MSDTKRVAVIGAGLAGLYTANKLQDKFEVTVFEKARGVGGRMSTRRADPYQFDHGAQYFTARSQEFKDFLGPYIAAGHVREWHPKVVTIDKDAKNFKREWFEPHYVAAPRMNTLCKKLAQNLDVKILTRINFLEKQGQTWCLKSDNENFNGFDWVVVTAPSHQASELLPHQFKGYEDIASVKMQGCFTLMLGLKDKPHFNWDVAMPNNSPIGWMAVNNTKPDREHQHSLVIQTTNEWAEKHIEDDNDTVKDIILRELSTITNIEEEFIDTIQVHKWRYASAPDNDNLSCYVDHNMRLAVCGDWCIKGRVEAAFMSANELVKELL